MSEIQPICIGCQRNPTDAGYGAFTDDEMTPDEYVRQEEGTFNAQNGHYWCDECYIEAGMPLGVAP